MCHLLGPESAHPTGGMRVELLVNSSSSATAPCRSVQEHEEVTSLIMPVVRPLLRPHLEDVELKIQPGAVLLTWTSMNIDGYIHIVKQVRG